MTGSHKLCRWTFLCLDYFVLAAPLIHPVRNNVWPRFTLYKKTSQGEMGNIQVKIGSAGKQWAASLQPVVVLARKDTKCQGNSAGEAASLEDKDR